MITGYATKPGGFALGAICFATPLAVGMISAKLSGNQMQSFGEMNQPPLSPPAWLFPIAWTILYLLMGITLLLIVKSQYSEKNIALWLFGLQLFLNLIWSPVFFVYSEYMLALIILIMLLLITIVLTYVLWTNHRFAAICLVPYIAWLVFATYLNIGVEIMN